MAAIQGASDGSAGPGSPAGDHKLVFLGGLHRSGTSILFRCLREHPAISGFENTRSPEDEGQHLQSVYPTALSNGGPGRFGFEAAAHLTETSPLASPESGRKLFGEWRPYWDLRKTHLLEKSPPNLLQTRFLQALFPDASFLMLLRHPVAVSYATRKWSRTTLRSLIRHWLTCHEIFEEDRKHLSRVLVLKYEDFVREPDATLAGIYAFLGLEPRPTTLPISTGVNRKYFQRWNRSRDNLLLRRYIRGLVEQYETRVSRFGYSLEDLDGDRPTPSDTRRA